MKQKEINDPDSQAGFDKPIFGQQSQYYCNLDIYEKYFSFICIHQHSDFRLHLDDQNDKFALNNM